MKSIKSKIGLMLILIFIGGAAMNAQPGKGKLRGIPGLSEDQKAQIHKLRISHLKDVQPIQNQIRENRAHFKTLMTAENPDMSAINKSIDEFGSLRNQLMKKQASHIQDVRKLLNDEQRIAFDRKIEEKGQLGERRRGNHDAGSAGWKKENQRNTDEGQK
jgi:Spy/CpxP family protein refolding chaperone